MHDILVLSALDYSKVITFNAFLHLPNTRLVPEFMVLQAEDVMTNYVKGRIENGYKLVLTMEIIDQSTIRGEKILVFRQDRHQGRAGIQF